MPNENCVILNGTRGTTVSAPASSSTVITPIRNVVKTHMLYYDIITKEVTYGTSTAGASASPLIGVIYNNFVHPTGDLRGGIITTNFSNAFRSNIRVHGSFMNYFTVAGAANFTITLEGVSYTQTKTVYTYSGIANHVITPFDVWFTDVPVQMSDFIIQLNSALSNVQCNTDANDYCNLAYEIYVY